MEAIIMREKQQAHALAEEYRRQGHEVIEAPSTEQLPDFLSGYHPDLLIRRGTENVVVEVKSRSSLARDFQIRDLARLLHARPGWNFELVVVSEGEEQRAPEGARPFDREDIRRGIKTAEELLESGAAEAALLLLWSTVEAVVRLLTEEAEIDLDRLTPPYIIKQATANGVISREDHNFLMHAMKCRNALAHGFKSLYFDSALVRDLLKTVKRLLEEQSVAPPA